MHKLSLLHSRLRRNVLGAIFNACSRSNFRHCSLANKVIVATYHKTGTQWMEKIFQGISVRYGMKYVSYALMGVRNYKNFSIIMEPHSNVAFELLGENYKGLHLIRDPRDCIVSGCLYHQVSRETWLHVRQKQFGGLTYQQKLNSYEKLEDKLTFEMENAGQYTIEQMLLWNYNNANIYEAKYEELIRDENLEKFHQIFAFLGFTGFMIPKCLDIAYKNSLFSGRIKQSHHVRSGEARQWPSFFTSRNKEQFKSNFGSALINLGYEKNNDW